MKNSHNEQQEEMKELRERLKEMDNTQKKVSQSIFWKVLSEIVVNLLGALRLKFISHDCTI